MESALGSGWWGAGCGVCPIPVEGTPTAPFPYIPPPGGPAYGALQCCLLGDIPAPLQQLDHGCHLSVRQLMPLHLASKFKLCVRM